MTNLDGVDGRNIIMINWKLRFKNKTTLTAIVVAAIAFIYQVLALFGIVPSVAESQVVEVVSMLINLLCLLGIVVDPTTSGVTDSEQALTYEEPKED